jgi:hypothetical protein
VKGFPVTFGWSSGGASSGVSGGDSGGGLRIGMEFALRLSENHLGTLATVRCLGQVGCASLRISKLA